MVERHRKKQLQTLASCSVTLRSWLCTITPSEIMSWYALMIQCTLPCVLKHEGMHGTIHASLHQM